jgi:hypothetical protein
MTRHLAGNVSKAAMQQLTVISQNTEPPLGEHFDKLNDHTSAMLRDHPSMLLRDHPSMLLRDLGAEPRRS